MSTRFAIVINGSKAASFDGWKVGYNETIQAIISVCFNGHETKAIVSVSFDDGRETKAIVTICKE